jgi:lysophospholipase L1-like esterase
MRNDTACTRKARSLRAVLAAAFVAVWPAVIAAQAVQAPEPAAAGAERFEDEIRAMEAADATSPPPKGGIVFIGSSSIRLWKTLADDFPGLPVVNRGFGGSQIREATHWAPRILVPLAPRLVVLYSGGNDLNAGRTPAEVESDFREFVARVHATLPKTRIAYISIAGNPARWAQVERVKDANARIQALTKTDPHLVFIDVFPHMLGPDGLPIPDIFVDDRLHMNDKGYAIWKKVVAPYLR